MSNISQINMSFLPEEDRILLRFGTSSKQEYRLWLTRRLTLKILELFTSDQLPSNNEDSHLAEEQKQMLQAFEKENALKKADFSTPYNKELAEELPLGENGVLVVRLDIKVEGNNVTLTFLPKKGQGMNINMNPDLRFSFEQLLKDTANKAEWLAGPASSSLSIEEPSKIQHH